jgi:Zn-dependent oligopeptidase
MKGARFDAHAQKRNAAIMERLSILETQFSQNVLADETEFTIVLTREDLSGCPEDLVAAARQAAVERDKAADECVCVSQTHLCPFDCQSAITASTWLDLFSFLSICLVGFAADMSSPFRGRW